MMRKLFVEVQDFTEQAGDDEWRMMMKYDECFLNDDE